MRTTLICGKRTNYLLTSIGTMYRLKGGTWELAEPYVNGSYLAYSVFGKPTHIHRMVAMSFIDNPDELPEVDHIDDDRFNNHVNNLRWVTQAENAEKKRGKKHRLLHPEMKAEIVLRLLASEPQRTIAERFNMRQGHVQYYAKRLKQGKIWYCPEKDEVIWG